MRVNVQCDGKVSTHDGMSVGSVGHVECQLIKPLHHETVWDQLWIGYGVKNICNGANETQQH